MNHELGILGAGNMAEAIVRGVIKNGLLRPEQIIAADVSEQRRDLFAQQLGIRAVADNSEVAKQSKIILLSVKPYQMENVLAGIGQRMKPDALVISIAAGVSTAFIEKHLGGGKKWRVIRTMPNTPMLVGEGMAAISAGSNADQRDMATARRIFESAAAVIEVSEDQLDAVTAISGSGPAYFFFLVEQMIRAGVELGLTSQQSHTLAVTTALGAAKMLISSSDSPQELRRKVTTPGGTTHAAISHMEEHRFPEILIEAIKAAEQRSRGGM